MASVAIMAGGAVLNAIAFIRSDHLSRFFPMMIQRLPSKKKNALEAYQAAYAKCEKEGTKLLDWIETQYEIKEQAKQNFMNTAYAIKLYNQMHQDEPLRTPSKPKFSDFYKPSALQKQGELIFVSTGALALGYAAFRFLLLPC